MLFSIYIIIYILIQIFSRKVVNNQIHLFHWIKTDQFVSEYETLTFGFDFCSFLLLEFCPKYIIESSQFNQC